MASKLGGIGGLFGKVKKKALDEYELTGDPQYNSLGREATKRKRMADVSPDNRPSRSNEMEGVPESDKLPPFMGRKSIPSYKRKRESRFLRKI